MAVKKKDDKNFLTYKGRPLVRRENTIYYGSFEDKALIVMTVADTKKIGALDIAANVVIELRTNFKNGKDRVLKKAERDGLTKALDIATFWLEDALENGV